MVSSLVASFEPLRDSFRGKSRKPLFIIVETLKTTTIAIWPLSL